MSDVVARWQPPEGTLLSRTITGWFVSHTDHAAAIAIQDQKIQALHVTLDAIRTVAWSLLEDNETGCNGICADPTCVCFKLRELLVASVAENAVGTA